MFLVLGMRVADSMLSFVLSHAVFRLSRSTIRSVLREVPHETEEVNMAIGQDIPEHR